MILATCALDSKHPLLYIKTRRVAVQIFLENLYPLSWKPKLYYSGHKN